VSHGRTGPEGALAQMGQKGRFYAAVEFRNWLM